MSVTATRAPSAASRRQVAAPMPDAPPVTRGREPCSGGLGGTAVPVRIGYKASAEQFDPATLLDFAVEAERAGLEIVATSDHFQPWVHNGGHSPAALPWLGAAAARTSSATLGTSVLTPTLRYHPSIVAQAFATLGCLAPGRVFLGVGTGEAMNETPVTGGEFPGRKERRQRLAEAIELMRLLWREERVDFEGEFYKLRRATIYDRPDEPVPIYVAASGPLAAKLAGRVGDGFICTSGKDPALYDELIAKVAEGAEAAGRDQAPSRFICSDDPDEVAERIAAYVELGFDELLLHTPGTDQSHALEQFSA